MHLSRRSTVHIPPPTDHPRPPVFHTSARCRHCPPTTRTVSHATACDEGLTECEACYEERVETVGVPFTLLSVPKGSMPHPPSPTDAPRD